MNKIQYLIEVEQCHFTKRILRRENYFIVDDRSVAKQHLSILLPKIQA